MMQPSCGGSAACVISISPCNVPRIRLQKLSYTTRRSTVQCATNALGKICDAQILTFCVVCRALLSCDSPEKFGRARQAIITDTRRVNSICIWILTGPAQPSRRSGSKLATRSQYGARRGAGTTGGNSERAQRTSSRGPDVTQRGAQDRGHWVARGPACSEGRALAHRVHAVLDVYLRQN